MYKISQESPNLTLVLKLQQLGHENVNVRCFFNNNTEEASVVAPKKVTPPFPLNVVPIVEANHQEEETDNIDLRYTIEDLNQIEVMQIIEKRCREIGKWEYIYSKYLHKVFLVGEEPYGLEILVNTSKKSCHRMGFKCFVCDKLLKFPPSMLAHAYSHIGVKQFPCRLCDNKYAYKQGLLRHWERNHKRRGPLNSFTAPIVLKEQTIEPKPQPIKPTQLPMEPTSQPIKSIPQPMKLRSIKPTPEPIKSTPEPIKSIPQPIKETSQRPTCIICSRSYSSKRTLTCHFNKIHSCITNYKCEYCAEGFYYKKDYRIHVEREIRNQRLQHYPKNVNGKFDKENIPPENKSLLEEFLNLIRQLQEE